MLATRTMVHVIAEGCNAIDKAYAPPNFQQAPLHGHLQNVRLAGSTLELDAHKEGMRTCKIGKLP